jgi:hypothetical protein
MAAKIPEVLYVAEREFNRQVLFVSNLLGRTQLEMVIWLYPESSVDRVAGLDASSPSAVNAIPVTTYPNHVVGRCTRRIQITDDLIENICRDERYLAAECDSFCIYFPGRAEWVASVILHEGVILIRDSSLLFNLRSLDFNASPQAPSWW